MNTLQTPDYGEPWKMEAYNSPLGESGDFEGVIEIRTRDEIRRAEACNPDDEDEDAFKRIVACVNACAGMADPAKEIEAMREAIKEAHDTLEQIYNYGRGSEVMPGTKDDHPDCSWCTNFRSTQSALAKLQPFIKP